MSKSLMKVDPIDEDTILAIEGGAFARAFGVIGRENWIRSTRLIARIKERKAYKQLGHTWDTFCTTYLGRSRRSVEEDLANLEAFDEEALEMMHRLGVPRDAMRVLRSSSGTPGNPSVVVEGTKVTVGDRRLDLQDESSVSEAIQALVTQLNLRANEAEDARTAADEVRAEVSEAREEVSKLKEKLTQKKVVEQDRRRILNNQGEILLGLSELTGAYATLLDRCRSEVPSRDEVLPHLRSIGAIHGELLEWAMRRHRYATPAGADPERLDELDRELARMDVEELEALDLEESDAADE